MQRNQGAHASTRAFIGRHNSTLMTSADDTNPDPLLEINRKFSKNTCKVEVFTQSNDNHDSTEKIQEERVLDSMHVAS